MTRLVILLVLAGLAFCQPRIVSQLDTFNTPSPSLLLIVNGTLPVSVFESTIGSDIVGSERDLILNAYQGPQNSIIVTSVDAGKWQSSSPVGVTAAAELQYDGKDNSPSVNYVGLGGLDFTKDGANAFLITAQADIPCSFTVTVYSAGDQVAYNTIQIQPSSTEQDYLLNYASFVGNVTFIDVGAVVIEVTLAANVDFIITQFAIVAPEPDVLTIDPFYPETATLIILTATQPFPQTVQSSTQGTGILGGERDILLTVDSGLSNRIVSTGVFQYSWSSLAAAGISASSLLQYDGLDASSSLNPTGLGGVDLSIGKSFHVQAYADVPTFCKITVYTSASRFSSFQIALPGYGSPQNEFFINFSNFEGSADFSNVGAIELEVDLNSNVDVYFTRFGISSYQ